MIALAGKLGAFHVAQQAVHFRERQPAMRLDRRLAGDIGKHAMLRSQGFAKMMCAFALGLVADQFAQQRADIATRQQRRHGAHEDAGRPAAVEVETIATQRFALRFERVGLIFGQCQHFRHQQGLRGHAAIAQLLLELFVKHALMAGVRIDQHQTLIVLCRT